MIALFNDLLWSRPAGFLVWGLGVLLVLFLRRKSSPVESATGTMELWKAILTDHERPQGDAAKRLPLRVWFLLAAIFASGIAVAGPRFETSPSKRLWYFEVDRSPSMFLPWDGVGGRSRYAIALAAALDWLDGNDALLEDRVWRTAGLRDVRASEPPKEWARRPSSHSPELAPPSTAQSVRLNWITDGLPEGDRDDVGYFASGGEAVFGAVGVRGDSYLEWDGAQLSEGKRAKQRSLNLDPRTPSQLQELARIWAEERGLRLDVSDLEAQLRITVTEEASPSRAEIDGDGWSMWVDTDSANSSDSTLSAYLRITPGQIDLAFAKILELRGDDAAFASQWSAIFDSALLPPAGVVPLRERLEVGSGSFQEPQATSPTVSDSGSENPYRLDAWFALFATLCACMAFCPFGRGDQIRGS
ncbi:MAG: hypothetical protein ACI8X5_000378 [Planctomycetota bacterium]|jgi:hypothetical protein